MLGPGCGWCTVPVCWRDTERRWGYHQCFVVAVEVVVDVVAFVAVVVDVVAVVVVEGDSGVGNLKLKLKIVRFKFYCFYLGTLK